MTPPGSPGAGQLSARGTESVLRLQVQYGDLERIADLLGTPTLLEDLRAAGRAVEVDPDAFGDDTDLLAAVAEFCDAVHEGIPVMAIGTDDLATDVARARAALHRQDQQAAVGFDAVGSALWGLGLR